MAKQLYNCPNCAAPIGYNERCPYCGTVLYWRPSIVEIKTTPLRSCRLRASVKIDRFDMKHVGKEVLYRQLVEQLEPEIVKAMTVRKDYDPRDMKMIYQADLVVCKE